MSVPGPGMDRDAPDLAGGPVFHLAGVHPGAGLQAERAHAVAHRLSAGDGPGRAVEHGQRAVACGVHQPVPEAGHAAKVLTLNALGPGRR